MYFIDALIKGFPVLAQITKETGVAQLPCTALMAGMGIHPDTLWEMDYRAGMLTALIAKGLEAPNHRINCPLCDKRRKSKVPSKKRHRAMLYGYTYDLPFLIDHLAFAHGMTPKRIITWFLVCDAKGWPVPTQFAPISSLLHREETADTELPDTAEQADAVVEGYAEVTR